MVRRLKVIPICILSSFSVLSASSIIDDAPYYRVRIVSSKDDCSHVGEIVDILKVKQTGSYPSDQLLKVGDQVRIVSSGVELESIVGCSFVHGIKLPALVRESACHYVYFGYLQGQENQTNFREISEASDK